MLLSVDRPHRILRCHHSLPELIDFSEDCVIGRTPRVMFGPRTDVQMFNLAVKSALIQQATTFSVLLYGKQGGDPNSFAITSMPYREGGELKGIQMVMHKSNSDAVPSQQKTENQKESAQRESGESDMKEKYPNAFAHEVWERVCLAQNLGNMRNTRHFRFLRQQQSLQNTDAQGEICSTYLASIARFIELLDSELSAHPECKIVYCVEDGSSALDDAALLLGAYMILRLELSADKVLSHFGWLPGVATTVLDAGPVEPGCGLTLLDSWRGLERGRRAGWISVTNAGIVLTSAGRRRADNWSGQPAKPDCGHHVVVPGRLVAVAGPAARAPRASADPTLAPGGPEIEPADLPFEDREAPSDRAARAFFGLLDAAAPGAAAAVRCGAAPAGRAGVLLALELMRSHGLGAREAAGWLRLALPGPGPPVSREQLRYLCAVEAGGRLRAGGLVAAAGPADLLWAGEAGAWRGSRGAFLPSGRIRRNKSA